jgi:hypothetical protein
MKWIRWLALLAGIVMFAVSFILPAVSQAGSSSGVPGIVCATNTLRIPWTKDGASLLHQNPVQYFSLLLSGWINPLFLVSLLLVLIKPRWIFASLLRYAVTLMFIACWVVFYQIHLYPRQGYFLWMFGILLALYSNLFSRAAKSDREMR